MPNVEILFFGDVLLPWFFDPIMDHSSKGSTLRQKPEAQQKNGSGWSKSGSKMTKDHNGYLDV